MDYDGDGDLAILSGSYTGELYLFEGEGRGEFVQGRFLVSRTGKPLKVGSSVTPEAVDYDGDGDLDLVVGTRSSGVKLVINEGTRKEPLWSPTAQDLKTSSGKKVRGSNAHHADWDGDGVCDLIVGSERGGAFWYPNLGQNDAPSYGERQVLVEEPPFEERSEAEGPLAPGSRTKVTVTDWNADGKLDLLIGDVQWLYEELPPLTEEQLSEKARIKPEYDRLRAAYHAVVERRNKHVGKPGGIPKELLEEMRAAREALAPTAEIWATFDRKKTNTHGWVWLYLAQDEQSEEVQVAEHSVGMSEFGPTTLNVVASPSSATSDQCVVEATLTIDPGWHVYAKLPVDSDYQLVRPTLALPDGVEQVGPWKCHSISVPDPESPDVRWFVKQVRYTCELTGDLGSPLELEVGMDFQVCNDELCLPPHRARVQLD